MNSVLKPLFVFVLASVSPGQTGYVRDSAPELLTFDELKALADTPKPAGPLAERMNRLLATPFVNNEAWLAGARPHRPERPELGPLLRAAMWNIERGSEFDLIRLAYTDARAFEAEAAKKTGGDLAYQATVREQLAVLGKSDVLLLNEVDLGMGRTGYRDVARELAGALGMNFVFGVEFLEVDKLDMGSEQVEIEDKELEKKLREDLAVDPARYKGIHGTAILSRYPIRRARILRFTPCYDWYGKEKEEITRLEKGKREAANKIFLERVSREVRHGGRMALIAEIDVPESPTGKVTVAAPHIENKCVPACRVAQLRELLAAIKEVDDPVITGGDMNTTGSDAAPMSVKREIKKRIRNPEFWAGQAIRWLTPIGLPRTFLMPANFFKNYHDPTARHIPLVAPNREYGFFQTLENFRFSDKHAFDLRGDPSRTVNQRDKTLGNSNQRGSKGFIPTFAFQRDLKGVLGQFKLDWFFIKPLVDDPYEGRSEWFAPHFPLTMAELNQSVPERVSDHHPITVDLPLTEVRKGAAPAP